MHNHHRELIELMVKRQIGVYGSETVVSSLYQSGLQVSSEGAMLNKHVDERLFNRVWLGLGRRFGAMAVTTSKNAVVSHCLQRHMPIPKVLNGG